MFESEDPTLGIYNRVDVNRLGYCNGMFMVKYDSIKPFNQWC